MAAKESADLMSVILQQSAEAAFTCAAQVMQKNHIIIDSKEINDDMFERAALRHVKEFTPDSAHAPFLQGMRSKGRVGTIVENPTTQEQIDTRTYGNSRARHREPNNRLMSDSESGVASPPPPLYPQGYERKGKSTGEEEMTFLVSFVTP